jgi:hypothetical protein
VTTQSPRVYLGSRWDESTPCLVWNAHHGFYFQRSSFLILSGHPAVTDSRPGAGLFRTKLNFAGAQRASDYFIIMITVTEVPVRSYGPIYSSKMSSRYSVFVFLCFM